MYPISKTDLDVLRFAHFLALAALTVYFIPKGWPGLKSVWLWPMILCGQHSLEIFCVGVFLAFAGQFAIVELGGGAWIHFVISVAGIGLMCAAAWLLAWYKGVAEKSGSRAATGASRGVAMKAILSAVVVAGLLAVAPACAQDAKRRAERNACRAEDLRGAGRPARGRRQHAG